MATFTPFPVPVRMAVLASSAEIHCVIFCYFGAGKLVHRLAYNGDVAAGQLAVFQGGPRRTGGKAPISGLIRVKRATRKNSQLAAARRVALKMGRRARCSAATSRPHFERNDVIIICETVH